MASAALAESAPRLRLRVRGAVQGVGFRPFAFRLARRLDLSGFVRNDCEGVLIEIEGAKTRAFVEALSREPPPLARIDAIEIAPMPLARRRRLRDRGQPRRPGAARASARTRRSARNASPSSSIPRAGFISIRSSIARIAARATRSRARCPTIARAPRWRPSRCARTARATTAIPEIAASTPSRSPVRRAGRSSTPKSTTSPPASPPAGSSR